MGSAQERLRLRSKYFFGGRDEALGEDDRLVRVGEDAIAEVPADGAGEDKALEIAAFLDQVGELVVLGDTGDVLLDDGAFVEDFGDVMAGGADQLDPACEGGVVGACSCEGRQKRVVHVDDALGIGADKLRREHLHIASEDGQVDGMAAQQVHLSLFDINLVGRSDRQIVEGDFVEVGERLCCVVIADDEREIAGQLSGLMAMKQVGQAVEIV